MTITTSKLISGNSDDGIASNNDTGNGMICCRFENLRTSLQKQKNSC